MYMDMTLTASAEGTKTMKITELSREALADKAAIHTAAMNEGGEGYNPYSEEMARRAREEARNRPVSIKAKRSARLAEITRQLVNVYGPSARHMIADYDQKVAALEAEAARLTAEEAAEFAGEWTKEITLARRAAWNARVKAGEFHTDGQIDFRLADLACREQGWHLVAIKRAKKLHGITS